MNHEGSEALAKEMVYAAHESGADAIKLQTFVPELYAPNGDSGRLEILRRFRLGFEATADIILEARSRGVTVFSTPLDLESALFLTEHCSIVKVSSGDITFSPLIELLAASDCDMILSTGASTEGEVRRAVQLVKESQSLNFPSRKLALLHCVSLYPAPYELLNLGVITRLKELHPETVIGYSDHSLGIGASCIASGLGARIVEKHFTLDKNQSEFRDHRLSAIPQELAELREYLDMVPSIAPTQAKNVSGAEEQMRLTIRRSIFASRDISAGDVINESDLVCLRPGTGLSPTYFKQLLGRRALVGVRKGEQLNYQQLAQSDR